MNKIVIALATIIHLLPHPFGVSTVGAMALYAGAHGRPKLSWSVPLLPLGVGLFVTGLYEPVVMALVFAGDSLATLAGRLFLARRRTSLRFAAAVLTGALIFYAVSNLSQWLVGYYPPTAAGLLECYIAGLPYLGQAVLADAAYCFVLFGLHRILERRRAVPATV